jgi:hypothetical protein
MERLFDPEVASRLIKTLKDEGLIPSDSFVTYGNAYVRKVCCG